MIKENKEDLRIQRTRNAISKTFAEMLQNMNYEKITIKQLAELANINRKTFYLHYNSLDDVLEELLQERIDEYARNFPSSAEQNLPRLIKDFFLYCGEENVFLQHIICDKSCSLIHAKILRKFRNLESKKNENREFKYRQNIIDAFLETALLGIFRQWVADEKRIPLDDIIVLATQLVCNGMHGVKT